MTRPYWFKAKKYFGFGWYPATWQGWLVLVIWFAIVVRTFQGLETASQSASDTLIPFIARLIMLVGALLVICLKTGEKPSWRWAGKPASAQTVIGWTLVILGAYAAVIATIEYVLVGLS